MDDLARPTPTGAIPSPAPDGRATAQLLGRSGVWSAALSRLSATRSRAVAQGLEAAGATTLWISEGKTSKELFSHAAVLLAATQKLVIAAGIANVHARDPQAMANGARTLGDAFPRRFVLGLGVSHLPRVLARGGKWRSPIAMMTDYLAAMDRAEYSGPEPDPMVPRVIGALGPRMTQLAAARTAGVHPYLVPVEHIVEARDTLGPRPLIAAELMVVDVVEPERARTIARLEVEPYLELDNYRRNLIRLGFDSSDLEGGGSDRLVDAIVAWGSPSRIAARIEAFRAAGADHVCIQILGAAPEGIPERYARIVAG